MMMMIMPSYAQPKLIDTTKIEIMYLFNFTSNLAPANFFLLPENEGKSSRKGS